MSRETRTTLYTIFIVILLLALCICYAQVLNQSLTVEGEAEGKSQEGVFITDVEYYANSGADTANSSVDQFTGTTLKSKVTLGSSSSSSYTYKVTMHNNSDREYVFIGAITNKTEPTQYSNTNIDYNVESVTGLTGLEEYVTTIAPGEYITFPVTFTYTGTNTSNPVLNSYINFRFREKPILELSNNEEKYTLENIKAGDINEYEFTVNNYNETYTNGVPLTYSFETTLTEGSPLTAKIYDSEGNEVTESISIAGDYNTQEDHTYTLKIEWDSSLDSTEYEGKSYTCTVKLTAIPDTEVDADLADYADYKIEQEFEIEITTCSHTWQSGVCTICGKVCSHNFGAWVTVTEATCVNAGLKKRTCSICGLEETETIEALGHNWVEGVCSRCGLECEHTFVDGVCEICGMEKSFTADGSWDGTVNTPILADGMEPVAWDSSGNEFTPTTNEEWYDYVAQASGTTNTSKWANAKTSDGSYWVWIPRYEYKITSTTTDTASAGTIDVRFIPTTTNSTTSGYTTTTAVNSTVNGVTVLSKGITVSSDGYIIHPAFTSTPSIGGWDSELAGIWVAKYEMSMETSGAATTTSSETKGNVATSSTIKAVSKPGVTSWRYINISNCYENSLAYDTSKNSHLMKNSEWGAVAYLTHSKYGRNGTEVTINSNSSYYTAGGSGATATTNVVQSSTGNATGIYDLSGCAYEYVAAFNDKYSSTGSYYSKTSSSYKSASGNNMGATGLANGGSTAYLTAYSNGTAQYYIGQSSGNAYTSHTDFAANNYTVSITGDAISEVWVSTSYGWFSDYSRFVYSSNPFFLRGGYDSHGSAAGVFYTSSNYGSCGSGGSFRVCLAEPQEQPIGTDQSYVGCYADMDRDGNIDGVIFADQGFGTTGTGVWGDEDFGLDEMGTYEVPKISSGLKEYYISQESYTIKSTDGEWDSDPHPVISPVEGTIGIDRFYVMKLSDFTTSSYSTFYWYYSAYSESSLDDPIARTAHDFGEGYEKTGEVIAKWNKGAVSNGGYGAQNDGDIWKHIQTEYANGWFIPSKGEWSAFGGELGITSSNYSTTYGLSHSYWSSSQYDTICAYGAYFDDGCLGYDRINRSTYGYVRLCTPF